MKIKRSVFVSGVFNVIHPGHLRLLRFAKESGDTLIVCVLSDKLAGGNAHVPEALRFESVKSISYVDDVFIARDSIEQVLLDIKPDIVVKGKEHELGVNIESDAVRQYGGKLIFSSGEAIFSSLDLIQREFHPPNLKSITLPYEYLKRHDIDLPRIKQILKNFEKLNICVIGDLIVDEYIACEPLGMSREDPTIVVTPIDSARFIGGSGIVAAHAAGMGARVNLIAVSGDDDTRKFASKTLNGFLVESDLIVDEVRVTTLKQRYRSHGKSLLRVSHLHQTEISTVIQEKIMSLLKARASDLDLLVFSDFNYGCLPQSLVDRISDLCNDSGVILVADSQSSSQIGDISRFLGMHLITPTEHEARIATRNNGDGLVVLAEQLKSQSRAKNIFLKLGDEGMIIHAETGGANGWLTDRIGALNSAPKDVAGAGDSLLIFSGMAIASGANIWEAAFLGSLAAAIQVGRVGNTPLQVDELMEQIN